MNVPEQISVQDRPEGVVLTVRVTPRSSRSQIEGVVDGVLRVRLAAPPVDGAANTALIKLLVGEFKLPKSRIEIVSGERSRTKQVLLRGVTSAEIRRTMSESR